MAALVLAGIATPNPAGLGTHQSFGLPPCSFRVLFGLRCPTCGMTTAWANLVRGDGIAALKANVAGTLLGIAAAAGSGWLLVSAARGRWLLATPNTFKMAIAASITALISLIEWGIRLASG